MFIKQRQVRKSTKFTSKFARTSQRRREYVATLYTTGAVQAILFVFLLIGAYRSYQLMDKRFGDASILARLALPIVVVAIAVVVLRMLIANIRRAVEAHRPPAS
jgi:uncharacterized membrane protein YuzA (DUF378 family)